MKVKVLYWLFIVAFAFSCKDPVVTRTEAEQLEYDLSLIDEYLAERNIQAQNHESGLRYVIHTMGTGAKPTKENCVTTNYAGRLLYANDDDTFDSGTNYTRWIKDLIVGWQIGLKLLPVGSSATFYVPSKLAYGTTGNSTIPANSILVFNVDLTGLRNYNAAGGYCYQ